MDFGEIGDYVKRHKLLIGGGVVIAVVGFYILSRGSSSGQTASGGLDPNSAAIFGQQLQAQAQNTAQQNQIQGQLDLATIQAGTTSEANQLGAKVDLAQIDSQLQLGQAQTAAQVVASNNALSATTAGINAQLAGLESNNRTTEDIATISANENTTIAGLTAATQVALGNLTSQTQIAISNNTSGVAIAQANDNAQLGMAYANAGVEQARINQSGATARSGIGAAGSIIGGIIGAIL